MLPIPDELQQLIEKRLRTPDRRQSDRRVEDIGPLGAVLSAETMDDVPEKDRRERQDRRKRKNRRGSGK